MADTAEPMSLYDFPKSSASYRVRIACNLKGIQPNIRRVDFRQNEQRSQPFLTIAPAGLIPVLVTSDSELSQSLAIMLELDRHAPEPRLIHTDPRIAARVWEFSLAIACDIHPLNNLRVLKYLEHEFDADADARNRWYRHWIVLGFAFIEARLAERGGRFAIGNSVSMADVCLVPQVFNARRFDCDLSAFPKLVELDSRLRDIPAFADAAPEL